MTSRSREKNARYYDRIANAYDQQLTAIPGDAWTRAAFRQLVTSLVPGGGRILDFGCGTGTDALWFSELGYQVIAYDNSPGMIAVLRARDTAAGSSIAILEQTYEGFLASVGELPPLDGLVADFAALNHLDNPRELLDSLAGRLRPGGFVIVSVLNPCYWREMIQLRWWRNWSRSIGHPATVVRGETDIYFHRVGALVAAGQPHYTLIARRSVGALIRPSRGPREWRTPRTLAERIESRWCDRWPLNSLGQFLFLAMRRS